MTVSTLPHGHVYLGGDEERGQLPFMWRLLGAQAVSRIILTDTDSTLADLDRMKPLFPEAWFTMRTLTDPTAFREKSWPPETNSGARFRWR